MIKILLSGACGKMGKMVCDTVKNRSGFEIVCGVDNRQELSSFPIYKTFDSVVQVPDVVIDFSNIELLDSLLDFCIKTNTPAVIATTGYTDAQKARIKAASARIPVFFSANMSIGVNLLSALAKKAAAMLGSDFDVEIVEKHHNQKVDAPSGTALMLANAVNSQFNDSYSYEYDRHSRRIKRPKKEIGIHSVRGGTIVGEHDVIFAGNDEVITLSHSAASKEIFAVGAVRAAEFIVGRDKGLYDMNDVLHIS